ncbi:MAG: hypothetical protein JW984_14830 [Deltaproteobacteria bacterium]|uniref:DUF354 domain-containing protein n=1 Tax=Candidatus Zymogenus saltonus TaxID=2844893 RepID=A0A9D8KIA9_9DELT|nr:hypothetical protein [Candidatus Zymogenus saltonus]
MDEELLLKYEEMLGTEVLRRLIIADRNVGYGLVSGAVSPRVELVKITRDVDMIRRYLVGLIDYIFNTLKNMNPDLVFLQGVAGSLSLAIYEISQFLGLKFRVLTTTRIKSLYICDNSPFLELKKVKNIYRDSITDPNILEDYISAAREYIESFRSKPTSPDYSELSISLAQKKLSLFRIAKQLLSDLKGVVYTSLKKYEFPLQSQTAWQVLQRNFKLSLKKRYLYKNDKLLKQKDLPKRPYCYYTLQVEPEASTMVLAPMHTDQIAVIESIAKSLPIGMNMVVKEHIPMLGLRPKGFYKRIKNIPGVFLVSPFEDNFELIKNADIVSVITGTAALEAIILGKPILIIGDSPILAIGEGAILCGDLSRLTGAIKQALESPPVDDKKLTHYIAAILSKSFEMPAEIIFESYSRVKKENIHRNLETIRKLCDNLLE